MPSHIHTLISSKDKTVEDIVRDLKRHTSEQMKKLLKDHPQESRKEWMLWMCERAGMKKATTTGPEYFREQQHNKPIEIASEQMYNEIVWYIHQNSIVSGFVYEAEQWIYSSSKGYAKNDGL